MTLENVRDLLARRRRHVDMLIRGPVPDLSEIAGVADVRRQGERITCTLLGDVAPFVRTLAGTRVVDLTIEPARLEDAFLEYYAEPSETDGTDAQGNGIPAAADVPQAERVAR
jgi:hypothetical protein